MHHIYPGITIWLCFSFQMIQAQMNSPEVWASTGDTYINPTIQVDWTIGEPIVDYAALPSLQVTQGFHQPLTGGILSVLQIKAYLQGPYERSEHLMRDDLRRLSLLPDESPYEVDVKALSTAFNERGNDNIVDWVVIEIRSGLDHTQLISKQSALIQRDGHIVGLDGLSPLYFLLPVGTTSYYVVVQHRNHLGVMTQNRLIINN